VDSLATEPRPTVLVASDCDAASVADRLADLRAAVDAARPDQPLHLDLTDGPPSVFALQLVAAAAVSLGRMQAFAGYGPAAMAALGHTSETGDVDGKDRPDGG
jgi:hypothetical protein